MAALSRMIGAPHGGIFKWVYPIPFGLITYMLSTDAGFIAPMLSAGFALLGKKAGHGRGTSLFEPLIGKPERLEWLVIWAMPPVLPIWMYKCLILAVCESVVWAGISYAVSPWLMFGLLCRPVAYLIGWSIWRHAENNGHIRRTKVNDHSEVYISYLPNFMGQPTQIGELLTGALNGVILISALYFHDTISVIR